MAGVEWMRGLMKKQSNSQHKKTWSNKLGKGNWIQLIQRDFVL